MPALLAVVAVSAAAALGNGLRAQVRAPTDGSSGSTVSPPRLTTTAHPPVPGRRSEYWLVPDAPVSPASGRQSVDTAEARFARGARLIAGGNFADGLPLVTAADLASTPLEHYGRYYAAMALQGLGRAEEADGQLTALLYEDLRGYLDEAAPLRLAEVALARDDPKRAAGIIDDLSDGSVTALEEVLLRLARAHEAAGNRERALSAYRRVYYEHPLSAQAADGEAGLERLDGPSLPPPDTLNLELARAEQLFAGRRWAQARDGFAPLVRVATGDDKELIGLRLAECEYYLRRHRAARVALRLYLTGASREAEARFFDLTATRALGDHDTYVRLARGLVADHPHSTWAEETLNDLASHYVTVDEDAEADRVFRELTRRFPKGRYGERAAWKIGWWAYKNDGFLQAAETFEAAALAFPRADLRPPWLYWAGRARDRLRDRARANERYRIVASDYFNSYYGRLASQILALRREPQVQSIVAFESFATVVGAARPVPTESTIRALISLDLYDDALSEVQYAQRVWGDSPALQATAAWVRNRRGFLDKSTDRFADVRGAITIMRRAYPQFLAAGGENLPPEVLSVIFPIDYWPLIKKYSDAHRLDPYLMTALVAQESTFTPDVRSASNAVGLMQLIPPTARIVARRLGIRPFLTLMLTQPETNVRLGMRYFKDLMERFGAPHYALAGYNGGPQRVVRWQAEHPGLAPDEFIEDIPFQETRNYVKRILGTAEDYRHLYGGGVLSHTRRDR